MPQRCILTTHSAFNLGNAPLLPQDAGTEPAMVGSSVASRSAGQA